MRRSLKVRQASDGKGDKQSQPYSHDLIYRYIVGQHVGVNQDYRGVRDQLDRTGDYLKTVPDHFSWHSWAVQGNVARLIFHADRESVIARRSGDLVVNAWGMYGLAEGFAKSGKLEVARKYVEDATCTLQKLGAWTVSIAYLQTAKVNLQAGDYGAAENSAGEAVRGYRQFRLFELTAPAVPLLVEAICGQRWFACEGKPSRERARRARFFARFARFLGGRFPNVKPHSFRVSGRRAALQGRSRRALKYFAKAIQAAEQIGANYELARTLIDRSMVTEANAEEDRRRGIELLESQGCVLPDGEVQYLGIDRDAHHDRARIAREREEAKIKAEGL